MIKRNKLSLFLLAIVAMLTIYYVSLPDEAASEVFSEIERYDEFVLERSAIISRRSIELEEISAEMAASNDASPYIKRYEIISGLTSRELALEEGLRNVGYDDILVCFNLNEELESPDVVVKVYDESFSTNQYVVVYSLIDEECQDVFPNAFIRVELVEKQTQ